MKRALPLLLLAVLLMGQDCKAEPAPPGTSTFCAGSGGSVLADDLRKFGEAVDSYVSKRLFPHGAIKHGSPSTDRRGTVKVSFSGGYCSGTVIGPHTVLTAAHCGWNAPKHDIRLTHYGPVVATSTEKAYPQEYMKWESNGDIVAREWDVMLVFTEEELPPPYIDLYQYTMEGTFCTDILAQGFGREEEVIEEPCPDGASRCLREARYTVNSIDTGYVNTAGRLLRTGRFNPGKICFGDSGGPLYAITPTGPKVAGVTSTTSSSDCELQSHHVHTGNAEVQPWIRRNTR